jgi:hypothetical protein
LIYKLPKPIYKILEKINTGIVYKLWKFRIRFFHFSQKKFKIK